MSYWRRFALTATGIIGLLVVAQWSSKAQAKPEAILSGSDIGFRVDGMQDGKPYGHFVVRLNGAWVDISAGPMRLVPAR